MFLVFNNFTKKSINNIASILTETVDMCWEILQAERTIAIRKRKVLNKFSVINNALCQASLSVPRKDLNHAAQTFS